MSKADTFARQEANHPDAGASAQQYPQPPPAYADVDRDDMNDPLLPRSSNDNIPDDFDTKYVGLVYEAPPNIRSAFMRKVYAILAMQLTATTIFSSVSFFSAGFRNWIQSNAWMMWVSIIGSFGFLLLTHLYSRSFPKNMLFLSGFTLLESYAIALVVSFYESKVVLQALFITLGIFLALTLFAFQSKYDFTSWAPYLFGTLVGVVLFGFIAAFFPYSRTMELVYSGIVALLFSAYIVFDTQMIMKHYHPDEEVAASVALYLDILNLFLAILRLLNNQNND